MKKLFALLTVLLLTAALLAACGCDHEWAEADCNDPKTCQKCGATEGEELGHDYAEADCENPKTCSRCGKTRGDALGHSWKPADCDDPEICENCQTTRGEALGHIFPDYMDCENPPVCGNCGIASAEAKPHTWTDATCTAPKTCSVCGVMEGEPAPHSWADATCDAPKSCTACGVTEGEPLGHTWVDATQQAPKTCSVCGLTEGEPLPSAPASGLGIELETFHAAVENNMALSNYAYTASYSFTDESGAVVYEVFDNATGTSMATYLLYYLCDDGKTVDSILIYSPNGADETISNLVGAYLGSVMVVVDYSNINTIMTSLMSNGSLSEDGNTYQYYTELNQIAYMMLVQNTGENTIGISCIVAALEE